MCYCWPKSLSGCNRQHDNTSCSFMRWVVGCSDRKGAQTVFGDFSGWPVRTVTVCNAIPSSWSIPQVPQCCIPTCADVSICDALLAEHADLLVHNAKTSAAMHKDCTTNQKSTDGPHHILPPSQDRVSNSSSVMSARIRSIGTLRRREEIQDKRPWRTYLWRKTELVKSLQLYVLH